jgi:hypothetical protein
VTIRFVRKIFILVVGFELLTKISNYGCGKVDDVIFYGTDLLSDGEIRIW